MERTRSSGESNGSLHPKKKHKAEPPGGTADDKAVKKLPGLLSQLLPPGEVLSLTTLAAIQSSPTSPACDSSSSIHSDILTETQEDLFEKHVGKRQAILESATSFVLKDFRRSAEIFNRRQRYRHFHEGDYDDDNYLPGHPGINGPRVDSKVCLEMFLGRERYIQLMEGIKGMNDSDADPHNDNPLEVVACRAMKDEVPKLPVITLLANVLEYLRQHNVFHMLRFTVVYGLDGAMGDVLSGFYDNTGPPPLTIDSPLLMDQGLFRIDRPAFFGNNTRMLLPAYGVAAILGHTNVIQKALDSHQGKIDTPFVWKSCEEGDVTTKEVLHRTPTEVLFWVILKNNQKSLRCLILECGFQFRWIDHRDRRREIFNRIFDAPDYESSPHWKGDLDEERLMWEGSRDRRRMRSAATYREQMKMLDLLIELGMPFEFFFPVEPNIALEEQLMQKGKLESREDSKAFKKQLTKAEWRARNKVWQAACAYNRTRANSREQLEHLPEFYRMLKSKWEGQSNPQAIRLEQYEDLDSSWRHPGEEEQNYYDDED